MHESEKRCTNSCFKRTANIIHIQQWHATHTHTQKQRAANQIYEAHSVEAYAKMEEDFAVRQANLQTRQQVMGPVSSNLCVLCWKLWLVRPASFQCSAAFALSVVV